MVYILDEINFYDNLKNLIITRITNNFKIKNIILFGSYAKENTHQYSDIDIIVILDKESGDDKYWDRVQRRVKIGKLFYDIKKKISMDILVYTRDEWEKLKLLNNSFIKEILSTGVILR